MKNVRRFAPWLRANESGQALVLVAFMMTVLLGMTGLAIDVGRAYVAHCQLQASSDAAALAGAQKLPNNTTATSTATAYSSVSGSRNAIASLSGVTMSSGYPKYRCLTTLTSQGIPCIAPANANAIVVRQQASVPMIFASMVGYTSMPISATATAAMRGAANSPYNVAIVLDSTASMNDTDSDSSCHDTRLNCALNGVQTMLNQLSPCGSSLTSCGTATNGSVPNPVDQVSLFTFPNVRTSTVGNDTDCTTSQPTIDPYTFPGATGSTYSPGTATYQILGYQSDYRTSSTSGNLNTSSKLVTAMGGGVTGSGKSQKTCPGMSAIGGQGTYFAGVVYAAQASLVAAKAANPVAQNVMIILSDGDASAGSSAMPGASTKTGTYPSTKNQCQQAVTAAQAAVAAGTRVYTVAYGAKSAGCSTDSPAITPCQTMQQMASSTATFYSDYTATGGSNTCISAAQPTTSLNQIFTQIAGDLTIARLLPDTTP